MRLKPFLALLLLAALSGPAVRAEEASPYFSLSTNRTFLPGEKVGVRVYSTNVTALEFRVYKVKDPAAFFERLENVHSFGRTSPREQIENRSFLEAFHDWKYDLWREIRDFFRMQFSPRSRAHIRESQAEARKSRAGAAEVFAQVPLLNSSQLVARWRQEMPSHFYSETAQVPLASLAKGVYLVEATDGALRAYTIAMVTELGAITKSSSGQLLVFTADRRGGAPVVADVRVWSDKKESARLKSDDSGLAQAALPAGQFQEVRVVAMRGEDVAIVTPYSYNLSSNPAEDWLGYVYTDRPVYRPGHTAHYKAILRTRSGERYAVPAGQRVRVLIEDPSGKQLSAATVPVSPFGTVHGDLVLGGGAALGYYSISVTGEDGQRYRANGGFRVEEYKKPEYEVKVTPATPRVLQGSAIEATIEARYFFGEPVANATLKYVVHTAGYWSPFMDRDEEPFAQDYEGGEGEEEPGYEYAGDQILEQSGRLGPDGRLTIRIPTGLNEHKNDVRYRIEARVTDEANREIAGHNSVVATYGSFQVGVSTPGYFFRPGEPIRATVSARDYDGKPVRTRVRVELQKSRFWGQPVERTVLRSLDLETGEDGTVPAEFSAQGTGSLILKVTARTPEGREVDGSTWLWIPGAEEGFWGGAGREIRMLADKKSYRPGETAHVVVMTGMPDTYLLVTTEGRSVESKRVVHGTGPAVAVDIPIGRDNQPNVYVSVAFWKDNNFYQSKRNLKVPAVEQKLQIDLQPSAKQFQPGQKASYVLRVRDAEGKPVVGEFSIGVVDEAIYAIYPDASGDPQDVFYGPVYDRVSTESSLAFYFSGEAGKREMFLAYRAAARPRALAQLKPERPVEPKVRKLFPDTALWLAELRTDAAGRAEARLEFPDSLTSWRATVRGATLDTKVGSAVNNVVVRKNVMVRLAVPRFFRQGDEVTVSAVVHNYLANAQAAQVSLEVEGLELVSAAASRVEVPSRGEARFDWRVRARTVRTSRLLAKALTSEESDAMELTLPVIPAGVKQSDARSGAIDADKEETAQLTLPADPAESAPTLDITLSSSFAGSIFSALDYLTSYPYGCTEQTMSSFLPNIVVARALRDLKVPQTVNAPELEKKIKAGMERLREFQHEDGGWGWWKDDTSLVFMTAYVVSGLAGARSAGYQVDEAGLQRAERWLHDTLARYPNMRNDLRAYVIYALASNGQARPEELEGAWSARGGMSSQGLAMAGLAFYAAGDRNRAKEAAGTLASAASASELEAYWPSNYDSFMEFEIEDSAETTAYAVRLLSLVAPESPLLPKAASWLVAHRNGGYFWDSTKQTAMVIFGLTEYLRATHEFEADFRAELTVNGKAVAARQFTRADALNPAQPSFHLEAAELRPGGNEIRIRKTGRGRLYWSASAHFYSSDKHLVQTNKLSLNVTRDYFLLAPEQAAKRIVYRLDPLPPEVHVGDVVAVRMTVAGGEWRYLLLEDPIPAGAEFISRDDLYELKARPEWWDYWSTRREFHDDRAAIFSAYFKGRHQFVYLLKVVNPGRFLVSPALVQPMYQPSIFATSDAAVLEVK